MKTLANEPRLKFPFYCKNNQSIMLLKLGIKGLGALVKRTGFIQATAAMDFVLLLCVEGSGRKKHIQILFFFFFSYALFCRVFFFYFFFRVLAPNEHSPWIRILNFVIKG